ncbi:MAG TPA: epoxide hydrolase [Sphingomicrobium sp.]|nr:epoxide hydrolase [Sphingomicrobium sp.]
MNAEQFRITTDPAAIEDLHVRLARTRWNDAVTTDWSYGTSQSFLQALTHHWLTGYNWREREERLNRLPHFRAEIDGFRLHFLHFMGKGPNPTPLLLMNGWPSSFIEYQRVAERLSDPAAFGGDPADAFDLVVPTLPGFGYSDRPVSPHQCDVESLFVRLMTEKLGYKQFGVAGTDIGAGIAVRIGHRYDKAVTGIHVTTVVDPILNADSPPLSADEIEYQRQRARWIAEEGAYSALQRTRPQTLAFGLADSPVGLASWIVEKFYAWSDCDGDVLKVFPMDDLIDNLMIYWLTGTIGSSVRHYFEYRQRSPSFKPGDRVPSQAAVLTLPKELAQPPREWAERLLNVVRYTALPRGGHFPAWEVPDAYAADLGSFFRSIRK